MKKLIFTFTLVIILLPNIVKAESLNIRLVHMHWYVNGSLQTYNASIKDFSTGNFSFKGGTFSQSNARLWPYNSVQYYFDAPNFDTGKTYDVDFVAYNTFSDGKQITARINNNYCTTVSVSNYFSFLSCKNIKLVNNNTNYLTITFVNNNNSSPNWSYGITSLKLVPSGTSNKDDILNYMTILDDNMKNQNQAIIDNQEKNKQEQIDNANQNSQNEINNANKNHEETMNTITDSTVDSDGMASLGGTDLPSNGALSSILQLPVKFLYNLTDVFAYNKYFCKPYFLTIPFVNYEFMFPCLNELMKNMGVYDWWHSFGYLAGGVTMWFYLLYLGHKFDDMSKLKEGGGGFGGL